MLLMEINPFRPFVALSKAPLPLSEIPALLTLPFPPAPPAPPQPAVPDTWLSPVVPIAPTAPELLPVSVAVPVLKIATAPEVEPKRHCGVVPVTITLIVAFELLTNSELLVPLKLNTAKGLLTVELPETVKPFKKLMKYAVPLVFALVLLIDPDAKV